MSIKIFTLSSLFFLLIISCFNQEKKDKEIDSEDWPVDSRLTDCDAFLNSYEEWVEDYFNRFKNKTKPGKRFSKDEIIESPKKLVKWAERWYALSACADHPKYQRRFEDISDEFKRKLKELEFIGKEEEDK